MTKHTKLCHNLEELRDKIDEVDMQIQTLINKRASLALEVGNRKRKTQEDPNFYRPEREAQIIRRVMERNTGPLKNEDMAHIFRLILSLGLALQQPIRVAFLGPEGTFSHAAAIKNFGPSIVRVPTDIINSVFELVSAKEADYGVVPIENSSGGVVVHTLDALMNSNLKICGEIKLPIEQHFLVNAEDSTPIRRIYSHQQSLLQCENWLRDHFPKIEQVAVSSNAHAAKLAKEEAGAAAIAGEIAAEMYGLTIQHKRIQDNPDNTTRFIVIGLENIGPSGEDKTSIVVNSVSNQPGILAKLTEPFAKHNVNVTLMEWRPFKRKAWDYLFFLDLEGHQEDENVKKAMHELEQEQLHVTVLGSYPRAVL